MLIGLTCTTPHSLPLFWESLKMLFPILLRRSSHHHITSHQWMNGWMDAWWFSYAKSHWNIWQHGTLLLNDNKWENRWIIWQFHASRCCVQIGRVLPIPKQSIESEADEYVNWMKIKRYFALFQTLYWITRPLTPAISKTSFSLMYHRKRQKHEMWLQNTLPVCLSTVYYLLLSFFSPGFSWKTRFVSIFRFNHI